MKRHREDAPIDAAMRADALLEKDEPGGYRAKPARQTTQPNLNPDALIGVELLAQALVAGTGYRQCAICRETRGSPLASFVAISSIACLNAAVRAAGV